MVMLRPIHLQANLDGKAQAMNRRNFTIDFYVEICSCKEHRALQGKYPQFLQRPTRHNEEILVKQCPGFVQDCTE